MNNTIKLTVSSAVQKDFLIISYVESYRMLVEVSFRIGKEALLTN